MNITFIPCVFYNASKGNIKIDPDKIAKQLFLCHSIDIRKECFFEKRLPTYLEI